MGVISFLLLCVVLAVVLWAINAICGAVGIAIPPAIQTLMLVAVVVTLVIILLHALGLLPVADVPIPHIR